MSLSLSDFEFSSDSCKPSDFSENIGLKLSDFENQETQPLKIETKKFISNKDIFPINDCYVIDTETYNLNSKIRMIQLYNVVEKKVIVFLDGKINGTIKDEILNNNNIKVEIRTYSSMILMIDDFYSYIYANPKPLIGHNLASFDMGVLYSYRDQSNYSKLMNFNHYLVGSGMSSKRVFFSYITRKNKDDEYDKNARIPICDTMFIGFGLGLKSSLKYLSEKSGSKYPKKDCDYKIFEKEVLPSEAVLYGIYDVLSIPDVLKYLRKIYIPVTEDYLKIPIKRTHLIIEHAWEKGSGCIADAFLNKLLPNGVSPTTKDFLSKYYGGMTRCWDTNLHAATPNEKIKYYDFTSMYPFSIRKQCIFDILSGNFKYFHNESFENIKDDYDKLIYGSRLKIKAKKRCKVIIEVEKSKRNNKIGLGYFRNFYKSDRVSDLQHTLGFATINRGEHIFLTKTEWEMSKCFFPELESQAFIDVLLEGMIPTSDKKTESYIQLYKIRKELKDKNDPSEQGIKLLLNSAYGKLCEAEGEWFNLACASSVTGYARASLFKTVTFAQRSGCEVLYSDTDSLYFKGTDQQGDLIQKYAEGLNEYPLLMGSNNLKDECEDILLFHSVKRKNYSKIISINGKTKIICKGEIGHSDLRWRDVLYRISSMCNGATDLKNINKNIQNKEFNLKIPDRNNFENFCKELYASNINEYVSKYLPVKTTAKITRKLNVGYRKRIEYEAGLPMAKFMRKWEEVTGHKIYYGAFFSINRSDLSFEDKKPDELLWNINYENYFSPTQKVPIITARQYQSVLEQEIPVDSVELKTRSSISMALLKEEEKKLLTDNIMSMGHVGIKSNSNLYKGRACLFNLRLSQDLDPNKVELLNREQTKKELNNSDKERVYCNANLFITARNKIESSIRINKVEMFTPKRNIFNIYKFCSELAGSTSEYILNRLEECKSVKTADGTLLKKRPVELDCFPRFTFLCKIDVCQTTNKSYARNLLMNTWDREDNIFPSASINKFVSVKLCKYLVLTAYNKQKSAERKIDSHILKDWERRIFELEKQQEWRAEIKLKLKRNFYEAMSYIVSLNAINQESFLTVIGTQTQKFSKKYIDFMLDSKLNATVEFNEKKCLILFQPHIIINYQGLSSNYPDEIWETRPLESSWAPFTTFSVVNSPPTTYTMEKSVVRWRFATSELCNSLAEDEKSMQVLKEF